MISLNILHISDSHIQKKNIMEIKEIVQKMIDDINKVQEEKNINIDLICFTGDLIRRGDKSIEDEGQWGLAMEVLVNPLLNALNLSLDRFVFVPGNHEVDIRKIVKALENGLKEKSLDKIKSLMDEFDPSYKSRLDYFYDIVRENQPDAEFGILGYSCKKEINGISIGLACVDSAWRSSGKGISEKGNLYIGLKQLKELYNNIEDTGLKICLMHHPIDWMEESEKLEVEKELSKYDMVLRGHVHEEDLKQVMRRNLKTIYSTAGKLYPLDYAEGRAVDGYNGYSIYNIIYDEGKCNVFLRTYYANNRKEFDKAVIICPEGEEHYDICSRTDAWQLKFGVIKGIDKYFHKMSDKYAMISEVDAKSPKDVQQILVEPVLSDKSEYVKENTNFEISIQDIMDSVKNILLIGKKESGKTTILQRIGLKYIDDYEVRGIIPIHVNLKYLPKGSDKILNSTIHFIQDNILEDDSISKREIIELIESGKMLFLLDNVKTDNPDHTLWITKFIQKYNKNRFILTIQEEFFQSLDVKQIPDYGTVFKEIYIQYMGKAQIREMVTKWASTRGDKIDINDTVNKIDSYCNQINFAKTPFNIAIFMVIWDEDNNFVPINEAIVMENYLEIILEKLSPKESLRSVYGFRLKQNFLSYIAHEMYLKNQYYLKKEEFEDLVKEYHKVKGYKLSDSRFDVLFFEKSILSYSGDYVVFSHTSFLEYFLAQYAYNNKEFLEEITKKGKRIYFRNEICFYSGLNQDCTELLENLSNDIISIVIEHFDLVEDLNDMQITAEFRMDKEQLISDVKKNRLSQKELDIISDNSNKYVEKKPTEISKRDIKESDAEDFFVLLQMYGSIIKNAELLDNKYKIDHLEYYMYGMNMLYSMMIKIYDYMRQELKYDELTDNEKEHLEIESEEEFEEMKSQMVDITKLLYPIAIQNMILENVGTPKLEMAINELMRNKQCKSFEIFMLIFLKCDLKIVNLKNILGEYIKNENSKDILKIALLKLTFYYRSRFFGNNIRIDNELIELIVQIHMKIRPQKYHNYHKSKMVKEIRLQLDNK